MAASSLCLGTSGNHGSYSNRDAHAHVEPLHKLLSSLYGCANHLCLVSSSSASSITPQFSAQYNLAFHRFGQCSSDRFSDNSRDNLFWGFLFIHSAFSPDCRRNWQIFCRNPMDSARLTCYAESRKESHFLWNRFDSTSSKR